MSPAGRPPLRGKSSMGKMLRVRLTEDEWIELEALALKAGVSMSEYVRAKVFAGGVRGGTRPNSTAKNKAQ